MSTASLINPGHIQQAKAALVGAGIPVAAGTQALDLATQFYHQTPQVSQTDALRRERNRIQDELETVSSQLQQERHKSQRLEQELAAARQLPKTHQNKAYQLRKHGRCWSTPRPRKQPSSNALPSWSAGELPSGKTTHSRKFWGSEL